MIDTHCHVLAEYYEDIDEVIREMKEAKVEKIIINGTDMKSNMEVLELTRKYDSVYGAIGFHPTETKNFNPLYFDWLNEHINDEKIVAVGEIGLDYHYPDTDVSLEKRIFEKQLEIAIENNKPVIVHTRDALNDTYEILSKYKLRGVIHAYSGSVEEAIRFTKIGFYLGIGGVSTFKNAKKIKEVINKIDMSYILLETDSPYLTPEPFRGGKNHPKYIPLIASKVAEIKEISVSEVAKKTTQNATHLFDF